jgi:alpha-D-ribose 1-methylphosphonate 5-triphosphate synthase subunit PhnH
MFAEVQQNGRNIIPGFPSPVNDAQKIFRGLLTAMSEPGTLIRIGTLVHPPGTLNKAGYAIALTLLDRGSSLYLSPSLSQDEIIATLGFHCQVICNQQYSLVDFAFCSEHDWPALNALKIGTEAYPDQSTTLVIQCDSFERGPTLTASGPGIETTQTIRCSAFNGDLLSQREQLNQMQPLGIDMIFTCDHRFFCLPRTTEIHQP